MIGTHDSSNTGEPQRRTQSSARQHTGEYDFGTAR